MSFGNRLAQQAVATDNGFTAWQMRGGCYLLGRLARGQNQMVANRVIIIEIACGLGLRRTGARTHFLVKNLIAQSLHGRDFGRGARQTHGQGAALLKDRQIASVEQPAWYLRIGRKNLICHGITNRFM